MTDLNDVIARLNPEIQKKIQRASQVQVERQELPSIGLTRALQGGLRYGGQHMFWGNRSGSKTTFALQTIAMAQKEGRSALLVDAEGAYTKEWGARLGVDNEELLILSGQKTVGGVTDSVLDYIRAGIDVVVIDSISALLPGSYFDDNNELKGLNNTNQIGKHAVEVGKMCGMFNMVNDSSLIILISQATTGIYQTYTQDQPQGGRKAMHFNTTAIKFTSSLTEKNQIMGKVVEGDRVFDKAVGRPVSWKIDKDRGPEMGAVGTYDFYYDGDMVGVDNLSELVDYAVMYGIIEKGGAWFTVGDLRLQGKRKVIEFLRDHSEEADRIYKEILA